MLDTLEFRAPPKMRRGVEQEAIDKVIMAWGYHPGSPDAKMDRENVRELATRAVRELRNQGWAPPQ
jgi:hypothetical protein